MAKAFNRFMTSTDLGRNRKLRRRLTVPERWTFVAGVLCIAGDAPVRGTFVIENEPATVEDLADEAGVTVAVATSTLAKLRDLGMLERDEALGCERIHDWADYNPEPKADRSNAERQRRWRERNGGSNTPRNAAGNRTSNDADNGSVTPPPRARSPRPLSPEGVEVRSLEERSTPPTPPTGGRARDRQEYEEKVAAWAADNFPDVASDLVAIALSSARPRSVEGVAAWLRRWASTAVGVDTTGAAA